MSKIVTAVSNIGPRTIVTPKVDTVPNVDPIGDLRNAQRTAQQHLLPSAIQPRFLNPVTQSPVPVNIESITLDDLTLVSQPISDGVSNPNTLALFIFSYTNTNSAPVSVELCASLFIDGTDFENAYPFGGLQAATDWSVERGKQSHFFDTEADPQTYLPNQANQAMEFITIKNLSAAGDHMLYIYYYWRAIANQGGAKT